MTLYDFVCETCGDMPDQFAPTGASHAPCPDCGGEMRRRWTAPTKAGESFGKVWAEHKQGRRLSPFERERREHWNRTRFGKVPGLTPADKTPKPKIFS